MCVAFQHQVIKDECGFRSCAVCGEQFGKRRRTKSLRGKKGNLVRIYGPICFYCDKEFPFNKLTVDHHIPSSKGGANEFWNLRLACYDCNQDKGSLMPGDYKR